MTLNLAIEGDGALGRRCFVSDLLAGGLRHQFTGTLVVEDDAGRQLVILLKDGLPMNASGSLVPQFRLGELLLERGVARQSQVASTLTQLEALDGPMPLSGALLVREGLDPAEVKRAVQEQTRRRIRAVLGLVEGQWSAQGGPNPRLSEIGVRIETLPTLLEDLPTEISDKELRWASDRWLGKALAIRSGGPGALADAQLDPTLPAILRYLEKPRKPDQLERAVKNRRAVRLALRLLDLLDRLEAFPIRKAVPIPRATLLKGQGFVAMPSVTPVGAESAETPSAEPAPEPKPRALTPEQKKLYAEIEVRHGRMGKQNHFEFLDVKQTVKTEDLRSTFTTLLRRFHPDTLGRDCPDDVALMARELTARLNDANKVLSGEASRAEYVAMLADERIKGDSQRAELVRDAETKAQMGIVLLRKREYAKARELFNYCIESDPVTPIYKAELAFAMYADRSFDRDDAFEKGYALLLEALKGAGSKDAKIHFYAGLVLKERERLKEALHHFKVAAKLQPNHVESKREVRLLKSRLKAQEGGKDDGPGGLGRFFKR
jgi:tetratricopeptide (TPR) repeat protein